MILFLVHFHVHIYLVTKEIINQGLKILIISLQTYLLKNFRNCFGFRLFYVLVIITYWFIYLISSFLISLFSSFSKRLRSLSLRRRSEERSMARTGSFSRVLPPAKRRHRRVPSQIASATCPYVRRDSENRPG